ncbi:MAG: hypothetical protein WCU80_11680 [Paludibacteraceae bacterium]|nr:hypothetical protein [Prevotellaceae bacterium]
MNNPPSSEFSLPLMLAASLYGKFKCLSDVMVEERMLSFPSGLSILNRCKASRKKDRTGEDKTSFSEKSSGFGQVGK